MPLQNRVDPFGTVRADPARGLFTGNRGVIHDPETKTLLRRRWTTRAWIVCALHFKDHKRNPMGRNARGGGAGWTELFFLDEVTALAAGHRPCFFCRRERARAFAEAFAAGNALSAASAPAMDARLHGERLAAAGCEPSLFAAKELPDGAMVALGGKAFAVRSGFLLPWSFVGYGSPVPLAPGETPRLLTPPSTLRALLAGYAPVWHPSG